MSKNEIGVLYIATGDFYLDEAEESMETVRNHMPNINITLATNDKYYHNKYIDDLVILSEKYSGTGISTIRPDLIPYKKTLFLDTDTHICDELYELFDLLDNNDLAVTWSPGRKRVDEVPEPWVEYNTGVVAFRDSPATEKLLHRWNDIYKMWKDTKGLDRNQPSFTKAVYDSDIDIFRLPREYNCRVPRFGYVNGKLKILHGRHEVGREKMAEKINSCDGPRVYWPNPKIYSNKALSVYSEKKYRFSSRGIIRQIQRAYQKHGLRYTLKKSAEEVMKILTK